ncbi:hypothetical protein HK100_008989 [Physocladia obscura]|uniref:Uncharacterized protein n=1 Tax=Physocladia obscura TaxID=109957 RepID=A0AAD5XKH6_9FUNG|nr:hypothetical protein HK100_008989 [Physocladia obscura]
MSGPTLDVPLGTPTPIRRLNLCCNNLGDKGLEILMEGLSEEIGILAIDAQYNDISDAGGRIVEQIVRLNGELVIVDLRNNNLDAILLRIITSLLQVNMNRKLTAAGGTQFDCKLAKLKDKTRDRPQPIEWLPESHPLESTFHSTLTTTVSSGPYETVRSAIRRANVLNHLRRHTSSSIKKQTFASTKDAENEIRRKRRKWEEVEEAAAMRIPKAKGENKLRATKITKQKLIPKTTKIPTTLWIKDNNENSSNNNDYGDKFTDLKPKNAVTQQQKRRQLQSLKIEDLQISCDDNIEQSVSKSDIDLIAYKVEQMFPRKKNYLKKIEIAGSSASSNCNSSNNSRISSTILLPLPKYVSGASSSREEKLWNENQELKRRLFEAENSKLDSDLMNYRRANFEQTQIASASLPVSREKNQLYTTGDTNLLPVQRALLGQKKEFESKRNFSDKRDLARNGSGGDAKAAKNMAESVNIVQNYCSMNSKDQKEKETDAKEIIQSDSKFIIDNHKSARNLSEKGEVDNQHKNFQLTGNVLNSIEKLAADLDLFIQQNEEDKMKEDEKDHQLYEYEQIEISGTSMKATRNQRNYSEITIAVKDTVEAFLQAKTSKQTADMNQETMAEILSEYLGMSSSTLNVHGEGNDDAASIGTTQMLRAVDESLSNFMALLKEIGE